MDATRRSATLTALSQTCPASVLQALKDFGFKIRLLSVAAPITPPRADPATRDVCIGGPTGRDPEVLKGNAVHEVAHALAYALGTDGAYLSEEGVWTSL